MKTFNEIPKLLPQDEAFFRDFLQQNASLLGIILPIKFEVKESPWKKVDGFSLLKVILIGEFLYSIYYLLDDDSKKGFFYFYYKS